MTDLKPRGELQNLHGKDHMTPEDYEHEFRPSMAALYEHNNEAHKLFDHHAKREDEDKEKEDGDKVTGKELKRMEEAWRYMEEKRGAI